MSEERRLEQRIEELEEYMMGMAGDLTQKDIENGWLKLRVSFLEQTLRFAESFLDDSDSGWWDSLRGRELYDDIRAALSNAKEGEE